MCGNKGDGTEMRATHVSEEWPVDGDEMKTMLVPAVRTFLRTRAQKEDRDGFPRVQCFEV
jgi:hypothetical protein